MPKGVPKSGFRKTKNWLNGKRGGIVPPFVSVDAYKASQPVDIDTGETDEEIATRLSARFAVMDQMTNAVCRGASKAMIVSGPPGLGKSYGVEKVLTEYKDTVQNSNVNPIRVSIIRGMVRATGLYKVLYNHRNHGSVICFDDADGVFFDDDALSLLKIACDTTETRCLNWLAETRMKDDSDEPMPTSYDFFGSVIFITNTDFDKEITRNSRLGPHLEALVSRSHYLDLGMKSRRDYLVRIKQVIADGMLSMRGLDDIQETSVLMYIEQNIDKLREISLRMAIKISDIVKMGSNWRAIADVTCLKHTSLSKTERM